MKIAVASGKGGTGKTTVAVALSLLIDNSIYVDMDVEEPNGKIFLKPEIKDSIVYNELIPKINEDICTFCGKCADACVYNAISIIKPIKKAMFFEELCHSCGACAYVCPVEGAIKEVDKRKGIINKGIFGKSSNINFIEGILDIGEPSAVPLISGINKMINDDKLYILDAPPGTSCPVVATLEESDYVVMVTEPTPFGLNDLKLALSIVKELDKPHGIVINKYEENNTLVNEFVRENDIEIIGTIPFDRKIAENYSKGIAIIDFSPVIKESFLNIIGKIEKVLNKKLVQGKES